MDTIDWLCANPASGLTPRQLPIVGLHSKWLEGHKGIVSALLNLIQGKATNDGDFFRRCGLTAPGQTLYQGIRQNRWGQNIRLEQERIAWNIAWQALQGAVSYRSLHYPG